MSRRVLVADDDQVIVGLLRATLELEGFEVETVGDGETALARVVADPPDLVLLDVMMPGLDGVEVLRRLRSSAATASVPVLLLTARDLVSDKIEGLSAGADDYVVKPFDSDELLARIRTTLRRTDDHRSVSPLTGLPGNARIAQELIARAASGEAYAVGHVDLDEFKSFNDAYGFLRGDALLLELCSCLATAASDETPPIFLGHVGGDDFVLICTPEQAERVGQAVVDAFDAAVVHHYDEPAQLSGHLVGHDRRGELRVHPLVTVSIGVACSRGPGGDHLEVVTAAAAMKAHAKSRLGSLVVVDRRL